MNNIREAIACSKYAEIPNALLTLELARAFARLDGRPITRTLQDCAGILALKAMNTSLRATLEAMSKNRFPEVQMAKLRDCIRRMETSLGRAQKQLHK